MRIHLKKRFTALMLAGMMVTSNVLPAYSATDGIAVEQADASYEAEAAAADASADAENSEVGGASSEQGDAEKPVIDADDTDSTTDASVNAGTGSGVADAAAGEQTTANKSEATDGAATEESKSDAANGTVTEESKADAANGTVTEESKSDAANGAETEESKSDVAHGTGAEESKADAGHGSHAGGSSVVGAGSVGIDESTGAAVEIEETKPAELLEEETKLATESEIQKEEDEKKLEEKENRKTIYIAFGKGVKVTATLEDANAVPDDARLRVTEIDDDEMYAAYLEAMDEAEPEIEHTKENTVLRDISFIMKDENGEETEYEPTEGSVKITIEYLENYLQDWFGVEDAAEVKTYHLPLAEGVKAEGEKTIDVQNVKASDINVQELDSEAKTEKKVEVEVDSFSMFAMRRAQARTTGSISLDGAIDKITVIKINDENFDPNKHYPRDAKIEFKMEYKFPENNKPVAGGIQTATYTLPAEVKASNSTGNITCEGYTAGYAGTYEIKDGKVIFNYSTEFLQAHPSGIEGTFSFKSGLSKESTNNKDQIKINFGGVGTTTPIIIKFEEGKVSAYKQYTLNEDGTIDFTIKLTVSDKDINNLVLTDTQGSNLAFADSPEFKLDGNPITPSGKGEQNVEFNIGALAMGEHTLTYKAKIKDVNVSGAPNKNVVNWSWTGGKGSGADTTVYVHEKKLKKSGTGDKNTNEITWTVIYVPGTRGMVAGKTFTDTLGPDQKYGDTYEVYYDPTGTEYYVGGTLIDSGKIDSSKTPFTYTFPVTQTANKGSYKIVYKTIVTKDLSASSSKETFTNTIRDDDGLESTGTAEIDKSKPQLVSKWGVSDSKTRIATWTVKVAKHPDNKPIKNLRVIDELKDNANWQGKYLSDDITVKMGSVILKRDTDYSVTFGTSTDGNPTMTIVFKCEANEEVLITYKTDYSTDLTKFGNAENSLHVTYKTDDDSNSETAGAQVYFENTKTKFELNKTGEIFGGVANWKVEINTHEGWKRVALPENVVQGIKDTIPEGMEYVEGSLKCSIDQDHYGTTEDPIPYNDVNVTYHKDTRELIIDINGLDFTSNDDYRYKYIVLEYQTRVTKKTVSGAKITFTNKVNVGDETTSASVDMTCTELDKQGKQVADILNVVEYKIGVNYSAADLLSGKDTLELKDTLDADLTLDTSSIHVTDMHTGESVDYKASFGTTSEGENTMTLTIPDDRALLVTYRASLVTAGKTKDTVYPVSNKATLTGSEEKTVEVNTDVKYETSEATVQGKSDSIIIKKVDGDGKALKNATFVVAQADPSSLDTIDRTEKRVITDKSGVAKFEKLSYNTLYYYQETQAPAGYKITDGAKHYFIIKNTKKEAEYTELIKKIKKDTNYAPLTGGNTFIVENEKIVGSLTFTKSFSGVTKDQLKDLTFTVKNVTDRSNPKTIGTYTLADMTPKSGETTVYEKTLTVEPGEYEVRESSTGVTGYTLNTTTSVTIGSVRIAKDESKVINLKNDYTKDKDKCSLKFTKSFSGVTKDQLENLTFIVKNITDSSNPKTIGTYTLADMTPKSGETTVYEKTLTVEPGEYEVRESSTGVTGYTLNTTTSVTIGSVRIAKDESKVINLKNEYDVDKHPVVISKTDASGSELEGAVLELTDAAGAMVDKWTSTTTARTFELKPGTYKFHEVSAPSGYLVADDSTFTVTIDGMITVDGKTVDKVVMIDRKKPEETTVPETTPAETTPAETTVPETTPAETTTPSGGGGGGGNHPHPLPETTPAETTPAETTVPETTPVETTTPDGGNGGNHGPSEEVETDEYGRVRGANRGKNKKGQDGGNVKGANRGKTRTGDESMMSIFGFGFLAAVLVLLGWFGIRFTKRNRR